MGSARAAACTEAGSAESLHRARRQRRQRSYLAAQAFPAEEALARKDPRAVHPCREREDFAREDEAETRAMLPRWSAGG